MTRSWAIVNPHGGKGIDLDSVVRRLADAGMTMRILDADGSATQEARQALDQGAELVVAVGGDGTIHQVVNGLAEGLDHCVLGVVPLGTGNDMARSLDLPLDPFEAIDRLEVGLERPMDLLRAQGSRSCYCVNHAAAGYSAVVSENASSSAKSLWGPLEYLHSAAISMSQARIYPVRLTIDDGPAREVDLFNLIISNGRSVAGGIPIAPGAKLDDGLMEVLVVPQTSLPRLALLVPQILLGAHLNSPDIQYCQAQRLTLESERELPWSLDGEILDWMPRQFEILPGALRVRA